MECLLEMRRSCGLLSKLTFIIFDTTKVDLIRDDMGLWFAFKIDIYYI
jgi:hypothetical protein